MNRIAGIVAVLAVCLVAGAAQACEKFQAIELNDAQQLLNKLKDAKSDTMTRVFAFNALACSTMPAVRQVAMKEALKIDDPIVKGDVLLEILMQRDAILGRIDPFLRPVAGCESVGRTKQQLAGLQIRNQGPGRRVHHGQLRHGRVPPNRQWSS